LVSDFLNYSPESGTNLRAIKSKLPAPARAANISPKLVGIVLEANKIGAIVISMMKNLIKKQN
tara:strand:+ start:488 stop:676 length:189 start_codon:yes stop_codon:yes gene_type:complete